MEDDLILRARIVWPITSAPIENGAVHIRGGCIRHVGTYTGEHARDLGDAWLIPGLVNAHCHLDYTNMAGLISPTSHFPDWIKGILALKAHWSYSEYAASWVNGARQLLESGCTSVGDIEAVPELLPDAWNGTPVRIVSFLEMTGVRSAQEPERILAEALKQMARLPQNDLHQAALSPHALYSTPPKLLELASTQNRLSIHVAESEAEWDMYQNASGPLYDWLKTQRNMHDCGARSPVQQAARLGLLKPTTLAIHCNYLAPGDAELLARANVVHCPGSHEYFKHAPFPYAQLAQANVNIALGTDSLASAPLVKGKAPRLDMWEEMCRFAQKNPTVAPETIFAMATVNGACALGLRTGAIEPGNFADLIAVQSTARDPGELLSKRGPIAARFINGNEV